MPLLRVTPQLRLAGALVGMAILFGPAAGPGQSTPAAPASQRVPVLVELFTSEGCSDCPPADSLLGQLDTKQPFANAQAIVLSEHVTYWNREGWTDPYSFDAMTDRQETYVRRFGLESSYTPQMVVDGTAQFVGSNAKALTAAIQTAEKTAKQPITIEDAKWEHGSATFSIHADAPAGAKFVAVLAADATHQEVSGGENAGRTLHHVAVVRVMKELGSEDGKGRPVTLAGGGLNSKNESNGPVRLVVFLVDHKTGRVLGAAEQTLQR
jgi:hypothetical protein